MTLLPDEWASARLSEISRAEYGKGLRAADRDASGHVPVFGSAGIVGYHNEAFVTDPVIVVGRKGNAGACFLSQGPCWPIDTTYFIRIPPSIDPKFLKFQLDRAPLRSLDSSTAIPSLRRPALEAQTVVLAPLNEQRRIVAVIEEEFSRLDVADASLSSAAKRVVVLREHAAARALHGDWPTVTLGEIAEIVGGVTKDAKRENDPGLVEVPYLRVANVQRGFLDLREVTTIRVPPAKAAALALHPGDVLFNEGGDRDKLGRGWVWSGELEGCIHQNHVFRARLNQDFEPKFVSWHGNTFGRTWFEKHGRQTTNLASLNLTTLRGFPVPAPPRETQQRIVALIEERLSAVDALRDTAARSQRRSTSLRRSILERAFRGELVEQDTSDEPASALLERIRAESAEAAGTRRRRVSA